ncbi:FecR domain-containing protein [Agriterribacter sp.]|uniref:FecR family protein n=1 Tax=Agriterribacter sp. TaxID=2821509 RepID=UPI002B9322F9|nr:FecR domain-containing protein [Agriterribacter sp.]HRO45241.1 FecR domain-containing protein [Agriterribacter sp.]HRQ16844.1 FecR domain-containing protein [Agriterribacter sp.]
MKDERIQYLFNRYRTGTCSPEEKKELSLLCLLPENQKILEKLLETTWEQTPLENDMPARKGASILQNILDSSAREGMPVKKIEWRRWVAAAAVIMTAGLGSYFFLFHKKNIPGETVLAVTPNDVKPPKTSKAVITLSDGSVLYLDSAGKGQLAIQGNVKLVKLANGQIAYETADGSTTPEPQYNTLSNPRGSNIIDIKLSDGSHVWLNAGSTIQYPVVFTGNERKVSITGEAYFEVTRNPAKPFKVANNKMEVTVLGTHFNVNAYDDEPNVKVTLLEGAVKIKHSGFTKVLQPGQQARITNEILVTDNIDIEEVMAWKTGKFVFGEKADIATVMRQVARWYNVDIEYRGKITSHFGGTISRQVNISEIINVLEATGHLKCSIEGRKIIVSP